MPGDRFSMKEVPFISDLGVELVSMSEGRSELALDLQPRHMNSWQVMHGGVILSMLDVCMSRAARSLDPEASGCATVELKTSFFQPGGQPGVRVFARGKVLHRSTTMYYCEGEIWNDDRLIAKAMGTFKTLKRLSIAKKMKLSPPKSDA